MLDLASSVEMPPCCPLGALVEKSMSSWRALSPTPVMADCKAATVSREDQRLNELIDAQLAQYPIPRALPEHYQVGYRAPLEPVAEDAQVWRSHGSRTDWNQVIDNKVSFHFQGASVSEVAGYFHHATGMTVRVDPSAQHLCASGPGIHVLCRDQKVVSSLRVVLGSCGLGYMVQDGELVLAAPEVIRQTVLHHGSSIETDWIP